MCGQKIPVGAVGTHAKTVGKSVFAADPRANPALRWTGVCQPCERFSQVLQDKGLGLSDPPRPPEINIQRGRPQTLGRGSLLAVPKIVVLAMHRRHHCGLDTVEQFPEKTAMGTSLTSDFQMKVPVVSRLEVGTLVTRSRMYPLSDV